MKGYNDNIEEVTEKNEDYRRVLYTGWYSQLVVMNLEPGDEIGNEMHGLDQFFRIEKGKGKVILNNGETEYDVEDGSAVIVPASTWHNVVNTGNSNLKLYTIYSPPEHKEGTVHKNKENEQEEHFDGETTE